MTTRAKSTGGTIAPTLRYRDVAAAIDWLCNAFGFERHLVVAGENGGVGYAQLTFGDGMVIVCPVEDAAVDGLMAQPEENGGFETQICYLFVTDVSTHYAEAKAAGAEIVLDLEDDGGCSRGYSCRDPEGHIWNFGSYDPRQSATPRRDGKSRVLRKAMQHAVALCAATAALIAPLEWPQAAAEHMLAMASTRQSVALDVVADGKPANSEWAWRALGEAREQLARERIARALAEQAAKEATAQLAQESNAKAASQPTVEEARNAIAQVERAAEETRQRLLEAERDAAQARLQIARERTAREAMERTVTHTRAQLAEERAARATMEHTLQQVREQTDKASKERPSKKIAHHPQPAADTSSLPLFGQW